MSCECDCHRDRPDDPCYDCCDYGKERIAKARKILTARIPQSQLADVISHAVDALEGK